MRVRLRNPECDVEVAGGRPVRFVLDEFGELVDALSEELLPTELYEPAGSRPS